MAGRGFSCIHYECAIRKAKDGSWVWRSRAHRPGKCKTMGVEKYLEKYLTRVFFSALCDSSRRDLTIVDFKLAYYFAANKRFFTCSRALMAERGEFSPGLWVFIGSWR